MERKTKIKPRVRELTREELGEWGVFFSHASDANAQVEELGRVFDEYGISYLWDHQIAVGSADFAADIISMIRKCAAAVVVISPGALDSQWVNFELGYLNGLGRRIYMYDPGHLLASRPYRYHYDPECPGYSDPKELAEAVKKEKLFYGLFNNETLELSGELFRSRTDEMVVPIHLSVQVPGLASIEADTYHVRALVIEFGSYTGHRYTEDSFCSWSGEDTEDDRCPCTGCGCCLNVEPDRSVYPECVLLNHTWDKVHVKGDEIEMILPLHKTMGTTFKIFVDTPYGRTADRLMQLFEDAGFKPGLAQGGEMNRVYITLPNNKPNGVFDLKAEFSNNFICPGALES